MGLGRDRRREGRGKGNGGMRGIEGWRGFEQRLWESRGWKRC